MEVTIIIKMETPAIIVIISLDYFDISTPTYSSDWQKYHNDVMIYYYCYSKNDIAELTTVYKVNVCMTNDTSLHYMLLLGRYYCFLL